MKQLLTWFWTEKTRITRYLVSGVSAVAVDYTTYVLATRVGGVSPVVGNIVSVLAGGAWAFIANKYWSFEKREATARQTRRFAMLFVANYVFQQYGFAYAVHSLGANDLLAKTLLIGMMVSWNFLLYKYWVYAVA